MEDNSQVLLSKPNVDALSFQSNSGIQFSNGQLQLLKLFNRKIIAKEMVKFEELADIYVKYSIRYQRFIYEWELKNVPPYIKYKIIDRQEYSSVYRGAWISASDCIKWKGYNQWWLQSAVTTWCKQNIGSLVMKGALVAIPVLKLGDDALACLDNKTEK